MKQSFIILLGYLLGSLSISIMLSRGIFHSDIRDSGSGNAGATNVARVFGWGAGLLTFAGDFAKGILSMYIGQMLDGPRGLALAGIACLIGHCFPLYYHFKGGKAVSVGAAVALMIDWRAFVLVLAVFILVALGTRWVSLASMSAAIVLAAVVPLLTPSPWCVALALFAAVLLIFMHRANIKRLLSGKEPYFTPGHRPGKGEEQRR